MMRLISIRSRKLSSRFRTWKKTPQNGRDQEYTDKTAFKQKLFERAYNIRFGTDIKKVGRIKRKSIISALNAYIRKHKQIIFSRHIR